MKKLTFIASLALILSGCTSPVSEPSDASCQGIQVEVNYGILDSEQLSQCVEFEGSEISAKDALALAGIELAGTITYPDDIVCRVNGLPAADVAIEVEGQEPHFESCEDMPPAFAYWALWVINDPAIGWEYATSGAATLSLQRGQTVGLAFASGEDAITPSN